MNDLVVTAAPTKTASPAGATGLLPVDMWTIYSRTIERFCHLSLFIMVISPIARIPQKSTSTNECIGA
jgi:hypothetical protein